VSANYFDVLGMAPHVGGFFSGATDLSSVVLSHRIWIRTFDGDPTVVGRAIRLNQQTFTIVGIAPQDFGGIYLGDSLDAWMVAPQPQGVVLGKLRGERSLEEARAEVAALTANLPEPSPERNQTRLIVEALRGVHPNMRRALGIFPSLLAATTICLLAIACANVAGLLLARADARRKEIAVRVALGASRRRVMQQLMTESILLSLAGGVLGLGLAIAGCRLLEQFFGYAVPDIRLSIDGRVLSMTGGLTIATGIVFGLAPAWHTTRSDLALAMRAHSYPGLSAIAVQTALCTVLLIGAGLLFQSLRAVLVRPGIDPDRVAHFRLRPSRLGYSLERARSYQRELLRSVEAVPGVERAVIARVPPERGWCCNIDVALPGAVPLSVPQNEVSPGFLSAMAIPILSGRDFEDGDRNVVIINQTLASRLWPKDNPLHRELWVDRQPHRVIGITSDVHAVQPGESAYPYLYLPMWARDVRDPRLFVRVSGPAAPMLERLRHAVVAVDPDVHVGQESTLAGRTEMSYQRERLLAAMLEFAGAVALLLSAIGIYALVSYQVSRRAREIGIRMALGAQPRQVKAWITRKALIATCIGLSAGALIALQAGPILTAFLYGVAPADAFTFTAAASALAIVSGIASQVPARAVSRIDPASVLRTE
jgi:predicted permease